jgi:hypothetical protein
MESKVMNPTPIEIVLRSDKPVSTELIMSGGNPAGELIGATASYLVRNGRPWFPIAGELHYSRYPRQYWNESLLKMKAGGVGVISTYVFWIHHEEIEGQFDWSDSRDLRHFLRLCARWQFPVLLRIGPWSHGECRNGGFPDWLMARQFVLRSNDGGYLACVRRFYGEIYRQAAGMLFKDGGPIVGIQLENEYGHVGGLKGEEGFAHMKALKRIARDVGFEVPLYTATGWGGAVVVEGEMIPVMSAYAAAPWTPHTAPLPPNRNYFFSADRDDLQMGNDLAQQARAVPTYKPDRNPYLMAELGPGIQVTRHRRPVVTASDSEALALTKLGSGANLLGYYMFHGGTNPIGKLSTLQESRETGSLNDVSVLSYDFQAPIGEFGQISDTYHYLKILHLFLNDFGEWMAQTAAVIPEETKTSTAPSPSVRYALRVKDDSGFLLVNHHQRLHPLPKVEGVSFNVQTARGLIRFPRFDLIAGRCCLFPFNLRIRDVVLQSATTQLLCKTEHNGEEYWLFFAYPEIPAVFVFDKQTIGTVSVARSAIRDLGNTITVTVSEPGTGSAFPVRSSDGQAVRIVTLSRAQAERCWKSLVWGRERILLSDADLQFTEDRLRLTSNQRQSLDFSVFPAPGQVVVENGANAFPEADGLFTRYRLQREFPRIEVRAKRVPTASADVGEWKIEFSRGRLEELEDLFLRIDFVGDMAELYLGDELLADRFYTGLAWEIGLKRFRERLAAWPVRPLRLRVKALFEGNPLYIEKKCPLVDGKALGLSAIAAWPQHSVCARSDFSSTPPASPAPG